MTNFTVRYPIKAVDVGDDKTDLVDGENRYLVCGNTELTLNQWQFIADALNAAANKGKFMPSK